MGEFPICSLNSLSAAVRSSLTYFPNSDSFFEFILFTSATLFDPLCLRSVWFCPSYELCRILVMCPWMFYLYTICSILINGSVIVISLHLRFILLFSWFLQVLLRSMSIPSEEWGSLWVFLLCCRVNAKWIVLYWDYNHHWTEVYGGDPFHSF